MTNVGSSSPRLGSITNREKLLHKTGDFKSVPRAKLSPSAPTSYAMWRRISFAGKPRNLLAIAFGTWLRAWSHAISHGPFCSDPVTKKGISWHIPNHSLVVVGCELGQ